MPSSALEASVTPHAELHYARLVYALKKRREGEGVSGAGSALKSRIRDADTEEDPDSRRTVMSSRGTSPIHFPPSSSSLADVEAEEDRCRRGLVSDWLHVFPFLYYGAECLKLFAYLEDVSRMVAVLHLSQVHEREGIWAPFLLQSSSSASSLAPSITGRSHRHYHHHHHRRRHGGLLRPWESYFQPSGGLLPDTILNASSLHRQGDNDDDGLDVHEDFHVGSAEVIFDMYRCLVGEGAAARAKAATPSASAAGGGGIQGRRAEQHPDLVEDGDANNAEEEEGGEEEGVADDRHAADDSVAPAVRLARQILANSRRLQRNYRRRLRQLVMDPTTSIATGSSSGAAAANSALPPHSHHHSSPGAVTAVRSIAEQSVLTAWESVFPRSSSSATKDAITTNDEHAHLFKEKEEGEEDAEEEAYVEAVHRRSSGPGTGSTTTSSTARANATANATANASNANSSAIFAVSVGLPPPPPPLSSISTTAAPLTKHKLNALSTRNNNEASALQVERRLEMSRIGGGEETEETEEEEADENKEEGGKKEEGIMLHTQKAPIASSSRSSANNSLPGIKKALVRLQASLATRYGFHHHHHHNSKRKTNHTTSRRGVRAIIRGNDDRCSGDHGVAASHFRRSEQRHLQAVRQQWYYPNHPQTVALFMEGEEKEEGIGGGGGHHQHAPLLQPQPLPQRGRYSSLICFWDRCQNIPAAPAVLQQTGALSVRPGEQPHARTGETGTETEEGGDDGSNSSMQDDGVHLFKEYDDGYSPPAPTTRPPLGSPHGGAVDSNKNDDGGALFSRTVERSRYNTREASASPMNHRRNNNNNNNRQQSRDGGRLSPQTTSAPHTTRTTTATHQHHDGFRLQQNYLLSPPLPDVSVPLPLLPSPPALPLPPVVPIPVADTLVALTDCLYPMAYDDGRPCHDAPARIQHDTARVGPKEADEQEKCNDACGGGRMSRLVRYIDQCERDLHAVAADIIPGLLDALTAAERHHQASTDRRLRVAVHGALSKAGREFADRMIAAQATHASDLFAAIQTQILDPMCQEHETTVNTLQALFGADRRAWSHALGSWQAFAVQAVSLLNEAEVLVEQLVDVAVPELEGRQAVTDDEAAAFVDLMRCWAVTLADDTMRVREVCEMEKNDALELQRERLRAMHEDELVALGAAFDEEFRRLRGLMENDLTAKDEPAQRQAIEQEEATAWIEDICRAFEREGNAIQQAEMRKQHAKLLEALDAQHQEALRAARTAQQSAAEALEELQTNTAAIIKNLQKQLERRNSRVAGLEAELADATKALMETIQDLHSAEDASAELNKLAKQHREKIASLEGEVGTLTDAKAALEASSEATAAALHEQHVRNEALVEENSSVKEQLATQAKELETLRLLANVKKVHAGTQMDTPADLMRLILAAGHERRIPMNLLLHRADAELQRQRMAAEQQEREEREEQARKSAGGGGAGSGESASEGASIGVDGGPLTDANNGSGDGAGVVAAVGRRARSATLRATGLAPQRMLLFKPSSASTGVANSPLHLCNASPVLSLRALGVLAQGFITAIPAQRRCGATSLLLGRVGNGSDATTTPSAAAGRRRLTATTYGNDSNNKAAESGVPIVAVVDVMAGLLVEVPFLDASSSSSSSSVAMAPMVSYVDILSYLKFIKRQHNRRMKRKKRDSADMGAATAAAALDPRSQHHSPTAAATALTAITSSVTFSGAAIAAASSRVADAIGLGKGGGSGGGSRGQGGDLHQHHRQSHGPSHSLTIEGSGIVAVESEGDDEDDGEEEAKKRDNTTAAVGPAASEEAKTIPISPHAAPAQALNPIQAMLQKRMASFSSSPAASAAAAARTASSLKRLNSTTAGAHVSAAPSSSPSPPISSTKRGSDGSGIIGGGAAGSGSRRSCSPPRGAAAAAAAPSPPSQKSLPFAFVVCCQLKWAESVTLAPDDPLAIIVTFGGSGSSSGGSGNVAANDDDETAAVIDVIPVDFILAYIGRREPSSSLRETQQQQLQQQQQQLHHHLRQLSHKERRFTCPTVGARQCLLERLFLACASSGNQLVLSKVLYANIFCSTHEAALLSLAWEAVNATTTATSGTASAMTTGTRGVVVAGAVAVGGAVPPQPQRRLRLPPLAKSSLLLAHLCLWTAAAASACASSASATARTYEDDTPKPTISHSSSSSSSHPSHPSHASSRPSSVVLLSPAPRIPAIASNASFEAVIHAELTALEVEQQEQQERDEEAREERGDAEKEEEREHERKQGLQLAGNAQNEKSTATTSSSSATSGALLPSMAPRWVHKTAELHAFNAFSSKFFFWNFYAMRKGGVRMNGVRRGGMLTEENPSAAQVLSSLLLTAVTAVMMSGESGIESSGNRQQQQQQPSSQRPQHAHAHAHARRLVLDAAAALRDHCQYPPHLLLPSAEEEGGGRGEAIKGDGNTHNNSSPLPLVYYCPSLSSASTPSLLGDDGRSGTSNSNRFADAVVSSGLSLLSEWQQHHTPHHSHHGGTLWTSNIPSLPPIAAPTTTTMTPTPSSSPLAAAVQLRWYPSAASSATANHPQQQQHQSAAVGVVVPAITTAMYANTINNTNPSFTSPSAPSLSAPPVPLRIDGALRLEHAAATPCAELRLHTVSLQRLIPVTVTVDEHYVSRSGGGGATTGATTGGGAATLLSSASSGSGYFGGGVGPTTAAKDSSHHHQHYKAPLGYHCNHRDYAYSVAAAATTTTGGGTGDITHDHHHAAAATASSPSILTSDTSCHSFSSALAVELARELPQCCGDPNKKNAAAAAKSSSPSLSDSLSSSSSSDSDDDGSDNDNHSSTANRIPVRQHGPRDKVSTIHGTNATATATAEAAEDLFFVPLVTPGGTGTNTAAISLPMSTASRQVALGVLRGRGGCVAVTTSSSPAPVATTGSPPAPTVVAVSAVEPEDALKTQGSSNVVVLTMEILLDVTVRRHNLHSNSSNNNTISGSPVFGSPAGSPPAHHHHLTLTSTDLGDLIKKEVAAFLAPPPATATTTAASPTSTATSAASPTAATATNTTTPTTSSSAATAASTTTGRWSIASWSASEEPLLMRSDELAAYYSGYDCNDQHDNPSLHSDDSKKRSNKKTGNSGGDNTVATAAGAPASSASAVSPFWSCELRYTRRAYCTVLLVSSHFTPYIHRIECWSAQEYCQQNQNNQQQQQNSAVTAATTAIASSDAAAGDAAGAEDLVRVGERWWGRALEEGYALRPSGKGNNSNTSNINTSSAHSLHPPRPLAPVVIAIRAGGYPTAAGTGNVNNSNNGHNSTSSSSLPYVIITCPKSTAAVVAAAGIPSAASTTTTAASATTTSAASVKKKKPPQQQQADAPLTLSLSADEVLSRLAQRFNLLAPAQPSIPAASPASPLKGGGGGGAGGANVLLTSPKGHPPTPGAFQPFLHSNQTILLSHQFTVLATGGHPSPSPSPSSSSVSVSLASRPFLHVFSAVASTAVTSVAASWSYVEALPHPPLACQWWGAAAAAGGCVEATKVDENQTTSTSSAAPSPPSPPPQASDEGSISSPSSSSPSHTFTLLDPLEQTIRRYRQRRQTQTMRMLRRCVAAAIADVSTTWQRAGEMAREDKNQKDKDSKRETTFIATSKRVKKRNNNSPNHFNCPFRLLTSSTSSAAPYASAASITAAAARAFVVLTVPVPVCALLSIPQLLFDYKDPSTTSATDGGDMTAAAAATTNTNTTANMMRMRMMRGAAARGGVGAASAPAAAVVVQFPFSMKTFPTAEAVAAAAAKQASVLPGALLEAQNSNNTTSSGGSGSSGPLARELLAAKLLSPGIHHSTAPSTTKDDDDDHGATTGAVSSSTATGTAGGGDSSGYHYCDVRFFSPHTLSATGGGAAIPTAATAAPTTTLSFSSPQREEIVREDDDDSHVVAGTTKASASSSPPAAVVSRHRPASANGGDDVFDDVFALAQCLVALLQHPTNDDADNVSHCSGGDGGGSKESNAAAYRKGLAAHVKALADTFRNLSSAATTKQQHHRYRPLSAPSTITAAASSSQLRRSGLQLSMAGLTLQSPLVAASRVLPPFRPPLRLEVTHISVRFTMGQPLLPLATAHASSSNMMEMAPPVLLQVRLGSSLFDPYGESDAVTMLLSSSSTCGKTTTSVGGGGGGVAITVAADYTPLFTAAPSASSSSLDSTSIVLSGGGDHSWDNSISESGPVAVASAVRRLLLLCGASSSSISSKHEGDHDAGNVTAGASSPPPSVPLMVVPTCVNTLDALLLTPMTVTVEHYEHNTTDSTDNTARRSDRGDHERDPTAPTAAAPRRVCTTAAHRGVFALADAAVEAVLASANSGSANGGKRSGGDVWVVQAPLYTPAAVASFSSSSDVTTTGTSATPMLLTGAVEIHLRVTDSV